MCIKREMTDCSVCKSFYTRGQTIARTKWMQRAFRCTYTDLNLRFVYFCSSSAFIVVNDADVEDDDDEQNVCASKSFGSHTAHSRTKCWRSGLPLDTRNFPRRFAPTVCRCLDFVNAIRWIWKFINKNGILESIVVEDSLTWIANIPFASCTM